jgi:hypothetical protein
VRKLTPCNRQVFSPSLLLQAFGNWKLSYYFSIRSESDQKEFDDAFDYKEMENARKSLETKRVKLNQAIQTANFTNTLHQKNLAFRN